MDINPGNVEDLKILALCDADAYSPNCFYVGISLVKANLALDVHDIGYVSATECGTQHECFEHLGYYND